MTSSITKIDLVKGIWECWFTLDPDVKEPGSAWGSESITEPATAGCPVDSKGVRESGL